MRLVPRRRAHHLARSMHARTNFALAVAATLAGTEAFMPAPVLSRGAVAPARAAVAPLRSGLAARKAVRGTGAVGLKANAHGKVKAEYIWIGGRGGGGDDYRSKTRVLDKMPSSVEELPLWNYDGSSTGQAPGDDSEVFLKPAFMCKDPMREGNNILVLCEMLRPDMTPIKESTRTMANAIFEQALDEKPWYGIEQEYTLFEDGRPMGWPKSSARPFNRGPDPMLQFGYPGPQGAYYCAVGADVAFGRLICEKHLDLCLDAGLNVGGINGEVMPGQWEYQVGPCTGIEAGDHMHMSRFLLNRVCEEAGITCSFDPKPIPSDDWNGAGCHVNFSTEKMRNDGGYEVIKDACEKLGKNHQKHIRLYGEVSFMCVCVHMLAYTAWMREKVYSFLCTHVSGPRKQTRAHAHIRTGQRASADWKLRDKLDRQLQVGGC